jgi:hypothetical protein
MTGYVFSRVDNKITSKIENVTRIDGTMIYGDTIASFNGGSNYIILETDTINLNQEDTINLIGLEDARDYFLIGRDYYFNKKMNSQKQLVDFLIEMVIQTTLPN